MKIYVFPEGDPDDPHNFVAPIRLLDPLRALAARHGARFLCHRQGLESEATDADLIIVQRACFNTQRELDRGLSLLAGARRAGARVVYELDDHIFCPNLPELIADSAVDELDDQAYELTQAHREILALADYLTCPTKPLGDALKGLGCEAKVFVIPTAIDFDLPRWNTGRPAPREAGTQVHIGWSGGSRVGRDLEIVVPHLLKLVRAHSNVNVVIAGALKYAQLFSEIPSRQLRLLGWVDYDSYPVLLSTFDLALIPMQDHAYNRCKSALKVIDYGAVGVPSICSPVAPYRDLPKLDSTPVLSGDDEWATRVEEFLNNRAANGGPSEQMAERTRRSYGLRENLSIYWSAFNEMMGA